MQLYKGQCIQRTPKEHPDKGDGFINIIGGSVFQIRDVDDRCITVRVLTCNMPSYVGGEMSIPCKYLTDDTYFVPLFTL